MGMKPRRSFRNLADTAILAKTHDRGTDRSEAWWYEQPGSIWIGITNGAGVTHPAHSPPSRCAGVTSSSVHDVRGPGRRSARGPSAERGGAMSERIYSTAEFQVAAAKALLAVIQEVRPDVRDIDLGPIIQMAASTPLCLRTEEDAARGAGEQSEGE